MVFTKREQLIGLGSVGAVALLALNYFFLDPYIQRRKAVDDGLTAARGERRQADNTFLHNHNLSPVWDKMTAGGLKSDPSEAEGQVLNLVPVWAAEAGVSVSSVKVERLTPEKDAKFQTISFAYTFNGPTFALSRLLYKIEVPPVPLKVVSAVFGSRKEGVDDVQLQLTVTTLCLVPDEARPDARPGTRPVALVAGSRAEGGGR